jgi:cobaltochelatase CobN
MHLLRTDSRSLDETAQAVDLDHSCAEVVFLSFTDSDLAALAAAHDSRSHPTLRLASLAVLKHPYSVDLYIDKLCAKARFVLVRLLGGLDYWHYGVEELAAAARRDGFRLAVIPGDCMEDPRLDRASTLERNDLRQLWAYFQEGGPDNLGASLDFIAARIGAAAKAAPPPRKVEAFGRYAPGSIALAAREGRALIVFYRCAYLAGDAEPILALARALGARGLEVESVYVSSLKDRDAAEPLRRRIESMRPDVILNATAFSARLDDGAGVLDSADAPVLQVILAGSCEALWASAQRGLGAADLAMNVILPEMDGRIITRAISFKAETERHDALEFTRLAHRPQPSRVDFVAALAAKWAALRRTPRSEKKLALILSDYPGKGGRTGYAVGLDTPQSALNIARRLIEEGYSVAALPDAPELMAALSTGASSPVMSVADYSERLRQLPPAFVERVMAAWGDPAEDSALTQGAFHFRFARLGHLIVTTQPDRGRLQSRKGDYHNAAMMPRHAYVAFYLWLRELERIDALIHCGTHGTLEWLPGKSVALSEDCASEAVLGPLPLIYPFIVNNPGEAAPAKRRTSAVIIGHLTPPLVSAGAHGATAEIDALFDEYSEAQSLDVRRARHLSALILSRAKESGLLKDCGAREDDDALIKLDAWLCDLKEMRIADGLHVFGRSPEGELRAAAVAAFASGAADGLVADAIDRCGPAELDSLIRALDGRFVEPGPAGAPARGRIDVLPTGRNLFTIDPRAAPTRTAWAIGERTAAEVLARYAQDHGEWPRRIVLDLWGSANMRTGGEDLAQAFALMGVRPRWDSGSTRVNGFEILPLASLGRPRVDVTLRISGLFRDVFPTQIVLFDAAVKAVSQLDEPVEENPLTGVDETRRIFGAAPGQYGVGISARLAEGQWRGRDELAEVYLAATSHAYGGSGEGEAAGGAFAASIAHADAFVHVQDMPGQDALDSDAFAEHEGGFAAAAAMLDNAPAVYHVDGTNPDQTRVRTVAEDVARVLRARATNPRWLRGQMRHGHRGAAEIAETVDNLFAYAALTEAAPSRHFDLLFEATCGDETLRAFLKSANPYAAKAIADKFEEAARRGFWTSRRNSSSAILAEMRGLS